MSFTAARRVFRPCVVLVLATLLVATACGQGDDNASGSGSPTGLDGRTFLSTAATGIELVADTRVSITFENGTVRANAGCNTMSGDYELVDGRIVVAQLTATEMGCDPPRHAQDDAIASLLMLGASYELTGDELVLRRDAIELRLTDRRVADPDRPLVGTAWELDTLIDGEVASTSPAGYAATLRIEGDRFTLDGSCNDFDGPVTVEGDRLVFGQTRMTAVGCGDLEEIERRLMSFFQGEATFTIEADRLTITNGDRGLAFRATV